LAGQPAHAHPSKPQEVTVAPSDRGVTITWRAEADDVAVLAGFLGLQSGPAVMTWEDGEYVGDESSTPAGTLLAQAPELLADYFLAHMDVTAGEQECTGALLPPGDVTTQGVSVDFVCEASADSVDIALSPLFDVDARYTATASGPDGQRASYTSQTPSHRWDLSVSGTPDPGRAADSGHAGGRLVWAASLLLLLTVLVAVTALVAVRRHQQTPHPQKASGELHVAP
jgi:hypothetical protein